MSSSASSLSSSSLDSNNVSQYGGDLKRSKSRTDPEEAREKLIEACKAGDLDRVKYWSQHVDVDRICKTNLTDLNSSPLLVANSDEVFEFLLQEFDFEKDLTENGPLVHYIDLGAINRVESLLSHGYPTFLEYQEGRCWHRKSLVPRPLAYKREDIAWSLVDHGAFDWDGTGMCHRCGLNLEVEEIIEVVNRLIPQNNRTESGIAVSKSGEMRRIESLARGEAIQIDIERPGRYELLQTALLRANRAESDQTFPALLACRKRHWHVLSWLMAYGADIYRLNNNVPINWKHARQLRAIVQLGLRRFRKFRRTVRLITQAIIEDYGISPEQVALIIDFTYFNLKDKYWQDVV